MGAPVKNQNFTIQVGDNLDLLIIVRDADGCDLTDLTGSTALWVLAEKPGCTPLLSKTGTLTSAINGEVTVSLDPADTADLRCGSYHHELQMTDGLSKVTTVMTGHARLIGDSAP
jgi:hypothetical protein